MLLIAVQYSIMWMHVHGTQIKQVEDIALIIEAVLGIGEVTYFRMNYMRLGPSGGCDRVAMVASKLCYEVQTFSSPCHLC